MSAERPPPLNHRKFALALLAAYVPTLGVAALAGAGLWAYHDAEQRAAIAAILREHLALVFAMPVSLLLVQGVLLQFFFRQYLSTPLELAERSRIILESNPAHRLDPAGGPELRELVRVINEFAERHQALQRDVDARIRGAQASVEQERNRLAALVSELAESVVVCNAEGRILLFNERARELLGRPGAGPAPVGGASLVGLGRSIFAIFERGVVAHALERIQARLGAGDGSPVARFVTAVGGRLLRVQAAPVLGGGADAGPERSAAVTGLVLVADDVTRAVETGSRRDVFLQRLVEDTRRAGAGIRAAVETVLAYPDMAPDERARFMEVIRAEAGGLSATLDRVSRERAASLGAEWLLEEMLGADLVAAASRRIEERLGVRAPAGEVDGAIWLQVDSHALVEAITSAARTLREAGVGEVRLGLSAAGRLARLDLRWEGDVAAEALAAWQGRPVDGDGGALPITPREVVERHDGELLYQVDAAGGRGFLRLLLPACEPAPPPPPRGPPAGGRPEFYDFDLFRQAAPTPDLDARPLADLAYTVFDTETTGLEPSAGDEIISVGAVRVLNGRILHHDAFEQLVDPRRPVSAETVRITGIDPAALRGQPTVDAVLPQFHRFCEDTVLVAHNAAFDLRFLQLQEERSGVRFTQPVLDTLLLSAVLQPTIDAHGLEALAGRLGVALIGRHTALGDAIMTAEIFLKLVPLLAEKGIVTLGQAREASRRTFQARIRY